MKCGYENCAFNAVASGLCEFHEEMRNQISELEKQIEDLKFKIKCRRDLEYIMAIESNKPLNSK